MSGPGGPLQWTYTRPGWIGFGLLAAAQKGPLRSRRRHPPGRKSLPRGRTPGLLRRVSQGKARLPRKNIMITEELCDGEPVG
jgi:hypothetical protein